MAEYESVMKKLDEIIPVPYVKGTTTAYKHSAGILIFEQNDSAMALWEFCAGISRESGYGEMGHVFLGGGSDAAFIQKAGIPTLCSCGVLGEWNHTDREYAVVDSLYSRAKLWCGVIRSLDRFCIGERAK
jgi:glutamate carboxypeptidase